VEKERFVEDGRKGDHAPKKKKALEPAQQEGVRAKRKGWTKAVTAEKIGY